MIPEPRRGEIISWIIPFDGFYLSTEIRLLQNRQREFSHWNSILKHMIGRNKPFGSESEEIHMGIM